MNNRPAFLLLTMALAPAWADTLTVTTVLDTVDASDGVMSLREAIIAANANLDGEGRCRGVNDIVFRLPATNAVAMHGTTAVHYYKLKINYHDPDYAKLMNRAPGPTTLPHLRCPVNLDGYTQPGVKHEQPLIEISGEDLPLKFAATPDSVVGEDIERTHQLLSLDGRLARQPADGPTQVGCRPVDPGCPLRRSASGSTIRGLLFNHAPQTALILFGAENVTITGNYFGLDATGENPAPNGRLTPEDIQLFSLHLNGASHNTIGTPKERNYFGVARSHFIMMWPFTVGAAECRATTNANGVCHRWDIGSSDNTVQANFFGLNRGGTRSLGGICILSGGDRRFVGERGCEAGLTRTNAIYTSGGPAIYLFFYPSGIPMSRNSLRRNRIGGVRPGEGNVFVAAWSGVTLRAVDTQIVGNNFGLAADGRSAEQIGPFFRMGIVVQSDSTGLLVEGNVIANSANFNNLNIPAANYGVGGGIFHGGAPTGPGASDDLPRNVIRANYIGTNTQRKHPGNNLIGLPATNAGGGIATLWGAPLRIENNLIAHNGYLGNGAITARMTVFNLNMANEQLLPLRRLTVLGNSMFCNGPVATGESCGRGMGIDWSALKAPLPSPAVGDGPTLNDSGDLDDGPAELQNTPILAAEPGGGGVTGQLSSKPDTRYRIQLFSSPESAATCVPVTNALQPGFVPDPRCASSGGASGGLSMLVIQGENWIGQVDVTTDANGVARFSALTPANRMVAATATRLDDKGEPMSTSELSQAVWTGRPEPQTAEGQ